MSVLPLSIEERKNENAMRKVAVSFIHDFFVRMFRELPLHSNGGRGDLRAEFRQRCLLGVYDVYLYFHASIAVKPS